MVTSARTFRTEVTSHAGDDGITHVRSCGGCLECVVHIRAGHKILNHDSIFPSYVYEEGMGAINEADGDLNPSPNPCRHDEAKREDLPSHFEVWSLRFIKLPLPPRFSKYPATKGGK